MLTAINAFTVVTGDLHDLPSLIVWCALFVIVGLPLVVVALINKE